MPGMDSANSRWLQSQPARLAEIQRSWQSPEDHSNSAMVLLDTSKTSIHIRSLGTLILQDDENCF